MSKRTLKVEMSNSSIESLLKELNEINSYISQNSLSAVASLMNATYQDLMDLMIAENLSEFLGDVNKEIINNGHGFRISTDNWILMFNEYGTGVTGKDTYPDSDTKTYEYNVQSKYKFVDKNGVTKWRYYNKNDGSFHTTSGMVAKHMFYDVKQRVEEYAKGAFVTAVNLAIDKKGYDEFRKSLDTREG